MPREETLETLNELKILNKKRGVIKAQLTRFETFMSTLTQDNLEQLPERLRKCEELWNKFDDIQTEIECLDETGNQQDERSHFENTYFRLVSEANTILSQNTSNISNTPPLVSSSIKLPSLDLPTFHGAYDKWAQFSDTFRSLVHCNSSLNNTQKFHYLIASVKGDAAEVIESMEVSDANYEYAWTLLRDRFENKQLSIHKHVKALFDIQPITKESAGLLRKLVDDIKKNLRALKSLKQPTEYWDTLLIYLFTNKLDPITEREWKASNITDTLPNMDGFLEFLCNRCQLLETLQTTNANSNTATIDKNLKKSRFSPKSNISKSFVVSDSAGKSVQPYTCALCKEAHSIFYCNKFLNLPIKSRMAEVKNLKLCWNCLRHGHTNQACIASSCKKCGKKHNTLLHIEVRTQSTNSDKTPGQSKQESSTSSSSQTDLQPSTSQQSTSVLTHCTFKQKTEILLSTARVLICDEIGNYHECRALLDSGSQSNFITRSLCDKLQLNKRKINLPVAGINQTMTHISHSTNATIKSKFNAFKVESSFLILDSITEKLPATTVDITCFEIPENITLADHSFNISGEIDLLLGSTIFWDLLCVGQIRINNQQPIMQKTKLGWIISGSLSCKKLLSTSNNSLSLCHFSSNINIQEQLEKFWRIEECQQSSKMTKEEEACEQIFVKTTRRDRTGRFIVHLPMRDNILELGDSYQLALKRFLLLEKKLLKHNDLKQQYRNFIQEYKDLDHMSEITFQHNEQDTPTYYLPHHAVYKEDSLTTKLRVVFDASAKSDSGISLNDKLMVGPTVQDTLFDILLRFRKFNIVIAGDIEKMYRQVLVEQDQRDLQRILWRENPDEPIQVYKLNTVTYGTACAAFLAVRCLQQVGIEHQEDYPEASKSILRDFYVDDLLSGSDTIEQAKKLKNDLCTVLSKSGFTLRKWTSNNSKVLEDSSNKTQNITHFIADDKTTKTLGLLWNSKQDILQYTVNIQTQHRTTKRSILSVISKIFDPLGLVGPSIIKAKIILQKLWQLQLDWDESIPNDLHTIWSRFKMHIPNLNEIKIPRHVTCMNPQKIQLHCFCDSSEAAYGACIYVRSTDFDDNHYSQLLCAKSKVAPLKNTALPRLELSAALLLSRLTNNVLSAIDMKIDEVFYWCDSTIVLSWLSAESKQWKTFVANRVSEIQQLTQINQWHHITSRENPADIISRGLNPDQLSKSDLWWNGPYWLLQDEEFWPKSSFIKSAEEIPEKRNSSVAFSSTTSQDIFSKFSTLHKLQRVVAFCIRFRKNACTSLTSRTTGPLTAAELNDSLNRLLKLAQSQEFAQDIHLLNHEKSIPSSSKLLPLNPFLDKDGILRVGGRLRNANLDYDQKHQIILPKSHVLTRLIILQEHHKQLHSGAQALLASIRTRYWLLSGRNTIRGILRKCVTCFKVKPTVYKHLMGELPKSRVTPTRPFNNCGVDYAGPFDIKVNKIRGHLILKAYICIFICFVTKAVHIEVVSDLTTEAFLNCLKRFISRRGKCSNIYSDNATNFVGANNSLRELSTFLNSSNTQTKVKEYLTQDSINWHFIPPRSPHFGGLWESAVKSTKYHLKRVVGNTVLTFEEFYTIATQVEACLNSRPLTPLSEDPHDLNALTPGHFLIGTSLTALPQEDIRDQNPGRLTRYRHLTQMMQHFWTRWSKQYLSEMQQRSKWQTNTKSIQVGNMVIIREENLPPLKWQLGRVIELHPGDDKITRVVSVKTTNGVFKRAVSKLCVLPVET